LGDKDAINEKEKTVKSYSCQHHDVIENESENAKKNADKNKMKINIQPYLEDWKVSSNNGYQKHRLKFDID